MLPASATFHATAIAIDGCGVLITGPSGAGKSDLALRLIDRGATLIADDAVILRVEGEQLLASPPDTITGQMEVRGVGIVTLPFVRDIRIELSVVLDTEVPRLPPPLTRSIASVPVRAITLDPRPASAPIKVELALRRPEAGVA